MKEKTKTETGKVAVTARPPTAGGGPAESSRAALARLLGLRSVPDDTVLIREAAARIRAMASDAWQPARGPAGVGRATFGGG